MLKKAPGNKRGVKHTRICWSIEMAARELGTDARTISKRLTTAGIDAGPDGFWSTKQIVAAYCGDLESERIRKTRAEADQIEKQNRKLDGELVDVEEFVKKYAPIFVSMSRVVKSSKLTDEEKDSILNELAKLNTT